MADRHYATDVIAGFGFDLSAWEVLDLCREEVGPIEDFSTATVRVGLLPLLAHPFDQWDRQRASADEGDDWGDDPLRHLK